MIDYGMTSESKKKIRLAINAEKRFSEAVERFMYAVFLRMKSGLESRGSNVEGIDYSDSELVDVGDVGGARVMALVVPGKERSLNDGDKGVTVVYIKSKVKNDETSFLERHSPWPVESLPFAVDPSMARSISRRVSVREVDFRLSELLSIPVVVKRWIDAGFIRASDPKKKRKEDLMSRSMPDGYMVEEDIVWTVVRQEFGIGDGPAVAHWRPMLDKSSKTGSEFDSFLRYLLGDDGALDGAEISSGSVSGDDTKRSEWFHAMLGNISVAKKVGGGQ